MRPLVRPLVQPPTQPAKKRSIDNVPDKVPGNVPDKVPQPPIVQQPANKRSESEVSAEKKSPPKTSGGARRFKVRALRPYIPPTNK